MAANALDRRLIQVVPSERQLRLQQMEFYGDYFGSEDGAEVAAVLQGCVLERQALMERLSQIHVGGYFHRLTAEQLVDILLQ